MEVKWPLHRALMEEFGADVPDPTFWIGAEKVRSNEHFVPNCACTFAVGKKQKKYYTVYKSTDACIIDENYRNGKGSKRRVLPPLTLFVLPVGERKVDTMDIDAEETKPTQLMDVDTADNVSVDPHHPRLLSGKNQDDDTSFDPSSERSINTFLRTLVLRSVGTFSASISSPSDTTNPTASEPTIVKSNMQDAIRTSDGLLLLQANDLDDSDVALVALAIMNGKRITDLHLSGNNIGDSGARALADVLKADRNLTWLHLDGDNVCDEGAVVLAEALAENETLQILDLSGNSIGDIGAIALSKAIRKNKALGYLYLSFNSIGNEGAVALTASTKENKSLHRLLLDNNCTNYGVEALLEDSVGMNKDRVHLRRLSSGRIGNEDGLLPEQWQR